MNTFRVNYGPVEFTDNLNYEIDMSNLTAASFHIVTTASTTGGAAKIQISNDGTNWFDVPSATATLTAASNTIITVTGIVAARARIFYDITSGTSNVSTNIYAKEHV